MKRSSPLLAVAAIALIAATGGTAVAAGELITSSDQVAPSIIDGTHLKAGSVSNLDMDRPVLRVRVNYDGALIGTNNDATVTRDYKRYKLHFRHPYADVNGPRRPLDLEDCAISVTQRGGASSYINQYTALHYTHDPANVLTVYWMRPNFDNPGTYTGVDTSFDVLAVC